MTEFIPQQEIEETAKQFLLEHHPSGSIPIPIEDIVEIKLGIKVIPSQGLLKYGIDAFLTHDFKEIYIDEMQYFELENRARFTFAHELGHYCLHKKYFEEAVFSSVGEWADFILTDIRRDPLETQANIFASYVLLPTVSLELEFEKAKAELAKHEGFSSGDLPDDQTLAPYLAKPISRIFKVSEDCATLRIKNWLNSKH